MPPYIARGGLSDLRVAMNMIVMYSFAGLNMENYPPTNTTGLAKACQGMVDEPTVAGLRKFLSPGGEGCFPSLSP